MKTFEHSLPSPVGPLTVIATDKGINAVEWRTGRTDDTPLLRRAAQQLTAYFSGTSTAFDVPLDMACSEFQKAACDAIIAIPFGETRTYGDLAKQLCVPAQAVGQACGGNPVPIIVPCHRVLGAQGLGGYSGDGGVETKVALLRHEGAAGLLI